MIVVRRKRGDSGRLLAVVVTLLGLAGVVPPALAGAPGTWTDVSAGATPAVSTRLALARSTLGVLHVFWIAADGKVYVSPVQPAGVAAPPTVAFPQSSSVIAATASADGLHLVFSGFFPGIDPAGDSGTFVVSAPPAGTPWDGGRRVLAASGLPFAGQFGDGVPLVGSQVADFSFQRGLDPSAPDLSVPTNASGGAVPTVAADGGGGAALAWHAGVSAADEHLAVQPLGPDGTPTGPTLRAPSLAGTSVRPGFRDQPPGASGRFGAPGIFLAYTDYDDATKLLLWRAGAALPVIAGTAETRVRRAVLDAAPDGQIWLAWVAENVSTKVIQTRQLRADGTTLGPIVTVPLPATSGFASVGDLQIDGQGDRVDIVISYDGKIQHTQAAAPAGIGGVSGTVRQADGGPVVAAFVEACPQPKGQCLGTTTDTNGAYSIVPLQPGTYTVTAFPPPNRILDKATLPAPIAIGTDTLTGQDMLMRGPIPLPKNAGLGCCGDVNGVPLIRRNSPIFFYRDVPRSSLPPKPQPGDPPPPAGSFAGDLVMIIMLGDDPEQVKYIPNPFGPAQDQTTPLPPDMPEIEAVITTLGPVPDGDTATPEEVPTKPGQLDYVGVVIGKDGKVNGVERARGLADCRPAGDQLVYWDPNFNRIPPQPNGLERYGTYCKIKPTPEGSKRGYSVCLGVKARLPAGGYVMADLVCYTPWVDPSGYVRATTGVPLQGAKVVLYRSGVRTGPFAPVENGSFRMAPSNRRNPDKTDATGHFGWDVVSGFYKVRASLAGCTSPKNRRVKYAETKVLDVPPPVLDLDIRLRCPAAPKAKQKPAVSGQLRVGKTVTCVRGRWTGATARFRFYWLRDGGPITGARRATYRLTMRDKGRRIGCLVQATSRFGNVVVRSKAAKVR